MSAAKPSQDNMLGFGFDAEESVHHFLVTIPAGNRQPVLISEHYTFDPEQGSGAIAFALGHDDGKLRVSLDRVNGNGSGAVG